MKPTYCLQIRVVFISRFILSCLTLWQKKQFFLHSFMISVFADITSLCWKGLFIEGKICYMPGLYVLGTGTRRQGKKDSHAPAGFRVKNSPNILHFLQFVCDVICYRTTHKFNRDDAIITTGPTVDSTLNKNVGAAENESVPKTVINNTTNLIFKTAISILVISNDNSFRVLFDKTASEYFI